MLVHKFRFNKFGKYIALVRKKMMFKRFFPKHIYLLTTEQYVEAYFNLNKLTIKFVK